MYINYRTLKHILSTAMQIENSSQLTTKTQS